MDTLYFQGGGEDMTPQFVDKRELNLCQFVRALVKMPK